MLEGGQGTQKGKGKAKKESAAALFAFYGTVTLNTTPISEGTFNECYYLERLVHCAQSKFSERNHLSNLHSHIANSLYHLNID